MVNDIYLLIKLVVQRGQDRDREGLSNFPETFSPQIRDTHTARRAGGGYGRGEGWHPAG